MFEKGMNNFRSARDEHAEIENRWRVLTSREARLNVREKAVREKETEIRRFINANPPTQMAAPMPTTFQFPTQLSCTGMPPPTPRNPSRRRKNQDKDYAKLAVKPDKNTSGTTTIDEKSL